MLKTATPLLAVLALGLGACGGGESNDATGAGADSQSAEDARVKFAQCLREQGIDVEDPGQGGGLVFRRGRGENPEAERQAESGGGRFEEAAEKCREKLGDLAPPELSEEERQEFQDQALAFARCMREQGIDMPDPEFGEGGRMTQRIEGNPGDDTRIRKAEEACKEFRPEPPGGAQGDGPRGGPGGP